MDERLHGARTRYDSAEGSRSASTKESVHAVTAQVRAGWNPVRPTLSHSATEPHT